MGGCDFPDLMIYGHATFYYRPINVETKYFIRIPFEEER